MANHSRGKYSYGMPLIYWKNNKAELIIGNFCSIATNVRIYLGGNHRTDWVSTFPFGHIHQKVFDKLRGNPK